MRSRRAPLIIVLVVWSLIELLGFAWLLRRGAGSPFRSVLMLLFGTVYVGVIAVLLYFIVREDREP